MRFCIHARLSIWKVLIKSLSFFHQSDIQHCSTSSGENVSKQLLHKLTERQLSKRQNEKTTHLCAGPFSSFSNRVWGLTWRNQYLPSLVLVWLFVIQWSSTEQVNACLVCLCSVESLIHHSGDVYRLEFQDYKHFSSVRSHLFGWIKQSQETFL